MATATFSFPVLLPAGLSERAKRAILPVLEGKRKNQPREARLHRSKSAFADHVARLRRIRCKSDKFGSQAQNMMLRGALACLTHTCDADGVCGEPSIRTLRALQPRPGDHSATSPRGLFTGSDHQTRVTGSCLQSGCANPQSWCNHGDAAAAVITAAARLRGLRLQQLPLFHRGNICIKGCA